MKNFVHESDTLNLIATAEVKSGDVFVLGELALVSNSDVAVGGHFSAKTRGVFTLNIKAAATAGQLLYFNKTTKEISPTSAAGSVAIGWALEAGAANSNIKVMFQTIAKVS